MLRSLFGGGGKSSAEAKARTAHREQQPAVATDAALLAELSALGLGGEGEGVEDEDVEAEVRRLLGELPNAAPEVADLEALINALDDDGGPDELRKAVESLPDAVDEEEAEIRRVLGEEASPPTNAHPEGPRVKTKEALAAEILALKREAVRLNREGNISEARLALRRAKLLEGAASQAPSEREPPAPAEQQQQQPAEQQPGREAGPAPAAPEPAQSEEDLRAEVARLELAVRRAKQEAVLAKRADKLDEARAHLRQSKALAAELERCRASLAALEGTPPGGEEEEEER